MSKRNSTIDNGSESEEIFDFKAGTPHRFSKKRTLYAEKEKEKEVEEEKEAEEKEKEKEKVVYPETEDEFIEATEPIETTRKRRRMEQLSRFPYLVKAMEECKKELYVKYERKRVLDIQIEAYTDLINERGKNYRFYRRFLREIHSLKEELTIVEEDLAFMSEKINAIQKSE